MDARHEHDEAGDALSIVDSATTPGTTDEVFVYDDPRRVP